MGCACVQRRSPKARATCRRGALRFCGRPPNARALQAVLPPRVAHLALRPSLAPGALGNLEPNLWDRQGIEGLIRARKYLQRGPTRAVDREPPARCARP